MSVNLGEYVLGKTLEDCFRDKDTGLPLAFGEVRFFEDANRLIPKEVFKYSGSPGNPSYTSLGSVVPLNNKGTFDDAIYYFPYDALGVVQLYFVEVYSQANVFQFSREAWPDANLGGGGAPTPVDVNYIPNGQFLFSTTIRDYPADPIAQLNKEGTTPISYGGWHVVLPASTATTIATSFPRQTLSPPPEQDPRYVLRALVVTSGIGDIVRDIEVRIKQENIFASDTDQFTFSFQAISNLDTDVPVSVYLKKNYGTGGSAPTETLLSQFTIGSAYTKFVHTFTFGDDSGKTLGENDDDYFALAIRLPLISVTDTSYVNFLLTPKLILNPTIPSQTTRDTSSRTLTLPAPAKDGSDLFLGIKLGRDGLEYDTSEVGKIIAFVNEIDEPPDGFLFCDGSKKITSEYSPLGIPYRRLFDKIGFVFGTGADYCSAHACTNASTLLVTNFTGAPVVVPSDGPLATGFTFNLVSNTGVNKAFIAGVSNGEPVTAGSITLEVIGTVFGSVSNPATTPGTAPLIIARTSGDYLNGGQPDQSNNSSVLYRLFDFSSNPADYQGKYFVIDQIDAIGKFYVWFTYNGAGADPAPGPYIPIKINLFTYDVPLSVACKIRDALNNFNVYDIVYTAASTVPPGSSFLFNAQTANYYVWYTIDGNGTDPAVANRTGIKVDIALTDQPVQIVNKTYRAINSYSYQIPDLRGMFLRGSLAGRQFDGDQYLLDPDFNFRFKLYSASSPEGNNRVGSIQWPMIQSHNHAIVDNEPYPVFIEPSQPVGRSGTDSSIAVFARPLNLGSLHTGLRDTRPWNTLVTWAIKY